MRRTEANSIRLGKETAPFPRGHLEQQPPGKIRATAGRAPRS